MTLLDEIIAASTDSSRSTADLLRMVQIVARRVGASEIEQWARHEIGGYPTEVPLPDYRNPSVNVMGTFTGPMNSSFQRALTIRPKGLEDLWKARLRQPIAELDALATAGGGKAFGVPWPDEALMLYEKSGVFGVEFYALFEAHTVVTQQGFRGIVDAIRSKALDFALDLQDQFPDAGELGGPNVATQPALAQTVYNITNNITGHGTNVATGSGINQATRVDVGDADGLRREAIALGLPEADADELVAAVREERDATGPRTTGIIEKVRSQAITLSGTVGTDVVVGLLTELVKQYLGIK